MAAAGFEGIYTSTNSGGNWTPTSAPSAAWSLVAASAEGSHLVAVGNGVIFTSADSGGTWVSNTAPVTNWSSVAVSADGGLRVATVNGGGIYVSQTPPSPRLEISRSGGNAALSWIVPSWDFVLQHNSDLTATNWADAPTGPSLNLTNLRYEVNCPPVSTNRFYRLKH